MSISKWWMPAAFVFVVVAGSACTQKAADDTTNATGAVLDDTKQGTESALNATKAGVDKALDATEEGAATVIDETREAGVKTADGAKNVAQKTGEATKEIAGDIADKSKDVASATGEAITDGWITMKVSATFVDEPLLKGSDINVDTNNHVVTLKGTVGSDAGKARAAAIARGTDGVTRVVNQLVVK